MSDVWIIVLDKYGYPIVVSAILAFAIYKIWQFSKEKDVQSREYFVGEIEKQRNLFTETINTQNKTFKETVDIFNIQITKLSENLIMNNEKLHCVEEDIKKVKDDVNEIKYTVKARD